MKTRNKIILIAVMFIAAIFVINSVIPGILFRQQDSLGLILYTCALGIDRMGSLMLITYDNGTHTIDENSCAWRNNITSKPSTDEYQEINGMSCPELMERHTSGEPYANKENKIFAESKISNCNFVEDWSKAQQKVDDWE
ncbi:hypothetical protein [Nitrosopumilus sp.]|uniref:hypothetical protein n=1 Tax=Nitrosopumilus sp. TaxID=2024843 RepID=UPI003B5B2985